MSRVGRALLWLSGANQDIFDNCPGERTKFIGVGGAVLTTATLAFLSSVLTFSTFLHFSIWVAVPLGLVWGLAILNLDRWLVATTRRQGNFWGNLGTLLPRLFLAVLIGLVISEPLVLRVFETEVKQQAITDNQAQLAANRSALDKQYKRITKLQAAGPGTILTTDTHYLAVEKQLTDLQNQLTVAQEAVVCEVEGTCGSGRAGAGPALTARTAQRDQLQVRVNAKQSELDGLKTELLAREQTQLTGSDAEVKRLQAARTAAEREFQHASVAPVGLLDRMEALTSLERGHPTIATTHWVLRTFILTLDALPVLVVLILSLGKPSLYELELEDEETELRRRNIRRRAKAREREELDDYPPPTPNEPKEEGVMTPAVIESLVTALIGEQPELDANGNERSAWWPEDPQANPPPPPTPEQSVGRSQPWSVARTMGWYDH